MRDLDILESWKEIADYLKKAERTCRRWEKEFGLPIHRMDGSPKARVFAYKHELDNWIQEMLHTVDDSEKRRISFRFQFITKKALFPSMVAVLIVIIALLIWHPWSKEKSELIPSDKPSLAILYFKNNTGDQSLDHWRTALSDWLITDLTQSKYIKVLRSNRLYTILQKLNLTEAENYTSEDIKAIASEGMASHVLLGSLSKAGDTFRLDYELQIAVTGDLVGSDSVSGNGEAELPKMVDEATRLIKANLNLALAQIEDDIDEDVGSITTSSPEAYKYYEEGARYYRGGENLKSIEFFEKAVEIDSEFALAYRDLAAAYRNAQRHEIGRKYIQKAFDLSHRISERERLRIQGDFLRLDREYDRAIEVYNSLLALYPDDWIGNNSLGLLYHIRGEYQKAIKHYTVNVDNRVEAVGSYSNLVNLYWIMEQYEEAVDVCQTYLNHFQHNNRIRWRLGLTYAYLRNFDLAIAEANKLDSSYAQYNRHQILGEVYMFMGDFNKSEKEFQKVLNLDEKVLRRRGRQWLAWLYRLQGRFEEAVYQTKLGIELVKSVNETNQEAYSHSSLSSLYFEQGRWDEALESCERALSLSREEKTVLKPYGPLLQKGCIYIKMGLFDEVDKIEDELKAILEAERNKEYMEDYYHLLGERELSKKNYQIAIDMFERGISFMKDRIPSISSFYRVGFARFMTGDFENAHEAYESITNFTRKRRTRGELFAKSFYMLGKIYERQGETDKAIKYYGKFLDLWKNADPGIAEVEDARERLIQLKSQ